jgi:hypothetical protein
MKNKRHNPQHSCIFDVFTTHVLRLIDRHVFTKGTRIIRLLGWDWEMGMERNYEIHEVDVPLRLQDELGCLPQHLEIAGVHSAFVRWLVTDFFDFLSCIKDDPPLSLLLS